MSSSLSASNYLRGDIYKYLATYTAGVRYAVVFGAMLSSGRWLQSYFLLQLLFTMRLELVLLLLLFIDELDDPDILLLPLLLKLDAVLLLTLFELLLLLSVKFLFFLLVVPLLLLTASLAALDRLFREPLVHANLARVEDAFLTAVSGFSTCFEGLAGAIFFPASLLCIPTVLLSVGTLKVAPSVLFFEVLVLLPLTNDLEELVSQAFALLVLR